MSPETDRWRDELAQLRRIALACELTEETKWGKPCYTFENSNIVILQPFKEYCALGFFKGALLKDVRRLLVRPGEHTQAGRQLRFTSSKEILELEPVVKAYILEAIEAEKAGLEVAYKTTPEPMPEELRQKLEQLPAFKQAFDALTPGRQRAYIIYISGAVQSKTRLARIAKCQPRILSGKGLND